MELPKIGMPTDLLRTPFVTVRRVSAQFREFRKVFDVVVFGPRAGVIPVDGDRVLMIRQYRFLPNAYSWEIPGGKVDRGEEPWLSAQRECREETGVLCHDPVPLITYWPGLDNVDNRTSLFYSDRTERVAPFAPDAAEVVEIAWMPLRDVMAMIARGEITDAFTLIGMLSYALARLQAGGATLSE